MDLADFPEDLLFLVLNQVPADSLIKHCRLVCRKWRDIVDSQALWKLKCHREGLLRGIGQVPPPHYWKRCYLKEPFNRNLIKNPCGADGFRNWQVENNNRDGWSIEDDHRVLPEAETQKCFASSFEWCSKKQTVDLLAEGLWEELLDVYQPDICVSDWYAGRQEHHRIYKMEVCLLAEDKTVIAKFKKEPPPIHKWNYSAYYKVSCVFRNYGQGVRYVTFLHRGQGIQTCPGDYKTYVTNSTIIVSLSRTEDLPAVKIIEKGSEASGGTELHKDDESDQSFGDGRSSDEEYFDGDSEEDDLHMQNTDWKDECRKAEQRSVVYSDSDSESD